MNELFEQASFAVEALLAFELNEIQKRIPAVEHDPALFRSVVRNVSSKLERNPDIGSSACLKSVASFQDAKFQEIDCVVTFKSGSQQIFFYVEGNKVFSAVRLSKGRVERPCSGDGYDKVFIAAVEEVVKELNNV